MELKIYQVDAFAEEVFRGNPAAVCPLQSWLDDQTLQDIAIENNLSETAFFTGGNGVYHLRWFTPVAEVDLCGHATLASAWVLFNELGETASPIQFETRSGLLRVSRQEDLLVLDFPLQPPEPCSPPSGLIESLGVDPLEVAAADDYLVLVKDEKTVRELQPDFNLLKKVPLRGLIVTAAGEKADFVSRWFGPQVGVDEDPVTGSAHTTLAPFWSRKLGKEMFEAEQVSRRGGRLTCKIEGDRVFITGAAVKYMDGTIYL